MNEFGHFPPADDPSVDTPTQQDLGDFPPPAQSGYYSPGSVPMSVSQRGLAETTSDDRTMAVLIHVLQLFAPILGSLLVWLLKREESLFVDAHGKSAINFMITITIAWLASFVLLLALVGFVLLPIVFLAGIVMPIIAAVKASNGELYDYPLAIKFIK